MKTITKIEPAERPASKKLKVAAYCRVSTDSDAQLESLEAQREHYETYIKEHDGWEFAGLYYDEGITGTKKEKRADLLRMLQDCQEGRIEYILTKSISRFSRNRVDCLTMVRQLLGLGVGTYFEKENIWTFDSKGELLISIMSSLAQEESRSISQNTTWGQRKRIADGRASVAYSHFLGYDKGSDGAWVINEEQAEIVRRIYRMFLEGLSYAAIARKLTEEGLTTPGGKTQWRVGTVKSILRNEKYKGDARLQKYFTVDYLTKKIKENEGEIPQYYVKDHHPAIIDPETFDLVQTEMERRSQTGKRYSAVSIFSSKIVCGDCGTFYGSKVWHSNDKYRKVIWRCNHKYKEHGHEGKGCSTPTLSEDEIKTAFVEAMNAYLGSRDEIIRNIETARKILCDTTDLEKEKEAQAEEMNVTAELMHRAVEENARVAQDQEEYEKKYAALEERYRKAETAFKDADDRIQKQGARNRQLGQMIRQMKELAEPLTEFDEGLWGLFVERMTVMADGKKIVRFKDGTEIVIGGR